MREGVCVGVATMPQPLCTLPWTLRLILNAAALAAASHLTKKQTTRGHFPIYVCVFYYCRTYYKAVRVGGEESGGHVL